MKTSNIFPIHYDLLIMRIEEFLYCHNMYNDEKIKKMKKQLKNNLLIIDLPKCTEDGCISCNVLFHYYTPFPYKGGFLSRNEKETIGVIEFKRSRTK